VAGSIVLGLLAWWWFRRKLRRLAEGIGELVTGLSAGVPPFRITLRPATGPEWNEPEVVERASCELERNGYGRAGDFVVPELNDMPLRGFVHPVSGVTVALYESSVTDLLVADVVAFLFDDTSITVTNAPDTGLERPPFARLTRRDINLNANPIGIVDLHDVVTREREGRRMDETPVERFAERFVGAWSRMMDWHVERGGVTTEEVRRIARSNGRPRPDDEEVRRLRAQWVEAIREFVEARIRDRFLRTGAMPAEDWEVKRDRVRFIHERTDVEDLLETLLWDIAENDSHIESDEDEDENYRDGQLQQRLRSAFDGTNVRDGFRKVLPLLPENLQWRYLCKVAGDYPADVYLTPQQAEDYDEELDH
jgi:hypothetical protein